MNTTADLATAEPPAISQMQSAATSHYTEGDTFRAWGLAALPADHPGQDEGRLLFRNLDAALMAAERVYTGQFGYPDAIAMNHHDMVTFTSYALKLNPDATSREKRISGYFHPLMCILMLFVEDEAVPSGSFRLI